MSQIVTSNSCLKCQIGISKNEESKWGLRFVREPLLRGWKGAGVEGSFADSFRKCAWNGAGGYRPASASALSALCSGIAKGAINAAWDAIGEVIKAWATEGHSVAVKTNPVVTTTKPLTL